MRYGIIENKQFVLIDDDIKRLEDTLPFMPQYSVDQIKSYEDNQIEQGCDGIWYLAGHAPEKPLEEAKAAKLAEINAACDAILNAAVQTYPNSEVLTFDQQTAEAKAYLASGNAADAPLLSALATGRGIEFGDLVNRVMAKHNAFSVLSGAVIGQRQALEYRLNACGTTEEVNALQVNYTLPEGL